MVVRTFFAFFCFSFILTFAHGQKKNNSSAELPVFTVNKKVITTEEFIYLYKKNHQNKPEEFTKEKIEEYLNLFINFKLKVAEAQHRGIDTTQAFLKEFNSYKDELRKPYLPDSKLLDSLVTLTYSRIKEEVKASHILINVSPEASPDDTLQAFNKINDLRKSALTGEDFGNLAQSFSEDPSAKVNKGNLGYFTAMQMVYPFENAAYNTKVGEVSVPVRTRFGYHIVKVDDRRPARGEVEVAHIMLRTGENADNEKAKNTIFDIHDQLQKGVSWNELCKQYSEDPSSKDNGGKLRPFGVGVMSAVPEFEQVAFELQNPGDISDPFQTQFGWHILKLERKIPLPSFEELAPSLKSRVSRDERVQLSKEALYLKLKKDLGYSENTTVKAKIFSLADTTLQNGRWTPTYPTASQESLFALAGRSYTVNNFFTYTQKNQKTTSLPPDKYLNQLFDEFVEQSLLSAIEEEIIKKSPEYKWLLKEYYEGILLFEIMEKEVWNKATEDSIGQKNYYDKNAAKYQAKERVEGRIYSATTKSHIDELKLLLERNDNQQAEDHVSSSRIRLDSGAYEKEDRAVLGKIPWIPGLHVAENNGQHYLIQVKRILPPGPKTFQEARPEVISDYQTYLEANWVAALKKKYPVKINKKGKQFVLQQLADTGSASGK